MTTDQAKTLRMVAEAAIHQILTKLTQETGLDLCRVEVFLVVKADDLGEPRRFAEAVRIELAV